MKGKHALALVILVFWIALGPLGMAFDGCLLMGALCEGGPCGTSSSTVFAPASVAGLWPMEILAPTPFVGLPANGPASLEPPPKSSLVPA